MPTKKIKSSQYWRASSIVLCDYLQTSLRVNIANSENIEEIEFLSELAVNAHSIITRDGTLDMRYDESLDKQKREVSVLLREVQNEALAKSIILKSPVIGDYVSRETISLEQIPLEGFKRVTEKLLIKVENFLNETPGVTFVEFSHGSSFYRLIFTGESSYELMLFSKKLDSWSVRVHFKTRGEHV